MQKQTSGLTKEELLQRAETFETDKDWKSVCIFYKAYFEREGPIQAPSSFSEAHLMLKYAKGMLGRAKWYGTKIANYMNELDKMKNILQETREKYLAEAGEEQMDGVLLWIVQSYVVIGQMLQTQDKGEEAILLMKKGIQWAEGNPRISLTQKMSIVKPLSLIMSKNKHRQEAISMLNERIAEIRKALPSFAEEPDEEDKLNFDKHEMLIFIKKITRAMNRPPKPKKVKKQGEEEDDDEEEEEEEEEEETLEEEEDEEEEEPEEDEGPEEEDDEEEEPIKEEEDKPEEEEKVENNNKEEESDEEEENTNK